MLYSDLACTVLEEIEWDNRELVAPYVFRPPSLLREEALPSCSWLHTPLHPYSAVQCTMHLTHSNMNLAQSTILGSVTNDPHKFEVLNHSFCSSNSGRVSSAFAKEKKNLQSERSLVIDHRDMPSSSPNPRKHSLANTHIIWRIWRIALKGVKRAS